MACPADEHPGQDGEALEGGRVDGVGHDGACLRVELGDGQHHGAGCEEQHQYAVADFRCARGFHADERERDQGGAEADDERRARLYERVVAVAGARDSHLDVKGARKLVGAADQGAAGGQRKGEMLELPAVLGGGRHGLLGKGSLGDGGLALLGVRAHVAQKGADERHAGGEHARLHRPEERIQAEQRRHGQVARRRDGRRRFRGELADQDAELHEEHAGSGAGCDSGRQGCREGGRRERAGAFGRERAGRRKQQGGDGHKDGRARARRGLHDPFRAAGMRDGHGQKRRRQRHDGHEVHQIEHRLAVVPDDV